MFCRLFFGGFLDASEIGIAQCLDDDSDLALGRGRQCRCGQQAGGSYRCPQKLHGSNLPVLIFGSSSATTDRIPQQRYDWAAAPSRKRMTCRMI
jgi:hypothetical protein